MKAYTITGQEMKVGENHSLTYEVGRTYIIKNPELTDISLFFTDLSDAPFLMEKASDKAILLEVEILGSICKTTQEYTIFDENHKNSSDSFLMVEDFEDLPIRVVNYVFTNKFHIRRKISLQRHSIKTSRKSVPIKVYNEKISPKISRKEITRDENGKIVREVTYNKDGNETRDRRFYFSSFVKDDDWRMQYDTKGRRIHLLNKITGHFQKWKYDKKGNLIYRKYSDGSMWAVTIK